MMDRLLELAERCEKAEGPHRNTDHEIARAIGEPWKIGEPVPRYTASLDAAMSLVPEDVALLDLELSWEPAEPGVHPAAAVRFYPTGKSGKDWHAFTVSAATPALALCAAALRARASQ